MTYSLLPIHIEIIVYAPLFFILFLVLFRSFLSNKKEIMKIDLKHQEWQRHNPKSAKKLLPKHDTRKMKKTAKAELFCCIFFLILFLITTVDYISVMSNYEIIEIEAEFYDSKKTSRGNPTYFTFNHEGRKITLHMEPLTQGKIFPIKHFIKGDDYFIAYEKLSNKILYVEKRK